MFDVMEHELSFIEQNSYGPRWVASCSCSDPDYEAGWSGQVDFYGDTQEEVELNFQEHLTDVEEGFHG